MRDFVILVIHLIVTLARLLGGPGGIGSVVAELLLAKQLLLILNRVQSLRNFQESPTTID